MGDITLGIAFIAGLFSFVSPCVLPLVPAYIGYMGGRMTHSVALQMNTGGVKRHEPSVAARVNMLVHGLAFVAGFTLVFTVVGLMTTAFFSVLGSTATLVTDVLERGGGLIIILFGLHFMGALRVFFSWLKQHPWVFATPLTTVVLGLAASLILLWALVEAIVALPFIAALWLWLVLGGGIANPRVFWFNAIDQILLTLYSDTRREMVPSNKAGIGGSFLMGLVFSAGWTPCIGPIYGAILTLAANTGDVTTATPLLLAYSLGLGLPFLLTALLLGRVQPLLRRLQRHMHTIELVSGTLLIVVGIMVASGQLSRLTQNLGSSFSDVSLRVEECGVGVFQSDLAASQVADCLNGSLKTVSINQSASLSLSDAQPQAQMVFNGEADQHIDVQIIKFPTGFAPVVTLRDSNQQVLATSETLTVIDATTSTALAAVRLPATQLYTVQVTGTPGEFRMKVVLSSATTSLTAETAVVPTVQAGDQNSPVLSSLTDLAQQSVNAGASIADSKVRQIAPDFTVTTLEGQTLKLSDLRGKVVLLNFWGTWCGPCRREMPDLQALYSQYGDVDFVILGLAVRDKQAAVAAFRDENKLTFLLALDDANAVTLQYAIPGQPSTFVIGKDGTILEKFYSITSNETLAPLIENALAQS